MNLWNRVRTGRGVGLVAMVAALGVAMPGAGWAQTPQLHGTVRSAETGEAVPGAVVEVAGRAARATTDGAGRWALNGLAAGGYTLRVSRLGYAPAEVRVEVVDGTSQRVDVALAMRVIELDPLTVVRSRMQLVGGVDRASIPGAAHVVSLGTVREPNVFGDVQRSLRTVPGLNIQEEEGFGLRPNIGMRGAGSDRSSKITVMEDGVLIAPAPYSAPAAYYFPTSGRMEAVEVRKGSSQVKYGPHTIGGALNLVSSAIPEEHELLTDLQAGGHGTRKLRARAGGSAEHVGWLVETYQVRTDGFKALDGGGETGYDLEDYLIKLRAGTSRTARIYQEVEAKLGWTDQVSNETYLGLTEADFARTPLRRYAATREDVMRADHRQVQVRHLLRPSSRFDVTTTLYRNDFSRNWYKLASVAGVGIASVVSSPESHAAALDILRGASSADDALVVRANDRTYVSQGVQSVASLRFGLGGTLHDLEAGVRYHQDEEDRFQHDDAYRMQDGRMVLTREGAPGSQANRVSEAEAWAFFIQDRITFGRWTLAPGVRFEAIDFRRTDYAGTDPDRTSPTRVLENGLDVVIPGVGASFEAAPGMMLFGGVHKGFSPPGPGADDEAKAEESVNYELGARLGRSGLEAEVVGFYNDYRNMLGRATLSSGSADPGDLFNGGKVRVRGLEASIAYDAAQPLGLDLALPLRLAYTYTHAEFRSAFESNFGQWGTVEVGDRLPYLPEHQLFASLGVDRGPLGMTLSGNYVGRMRTEAGQGDLPPGTGTDPHLIVDLSATYIVNSWSQLYVSGQNLTDRSYIVSRHPAGVRPGLPRTFAVGLRLMR